MRYLQAKAPATNTHRSVMARWRIGQRVEGEEWVRNRKQMCPVTVNGAAESSPSRVRTHTSHPHILFFPAHHILPILLTSPHVERFISEQFSSEAALTLYPPKTDHKVTPIQKSFKTHQGQLTTTQKTITPHQSAGDP